MESESTGQRIVAHQPVLGVWSLPHADCHGRLQYHGQMVNGGEKWDFVREIEIENAHVVTERWM